MTSSITLNRLIAPSLALGFAASCAVLAPDRTPRSRDKSTLDNAHWVHDTRLRELMDQLREHRATDWPQEIEDEYGGQTSPRSQQVFKELESHAMGLADTAQLIPKAVADITMTEVDRRSFLAQVETLHDQADRLQAFAAAGDLSGARGVLDAIENTCDSCHRRFRDFAGPRLQSREKP